MAESSSNISRWRSQVICSESNRLKIKLFLLISSSSSSSSSHRFFLLASVYEKLIISLFELDVIYASLNIHITHQWTFLTVLPSRCCLRDLPHGIYSLTCGLLKSYFKFLYTAMKHPQQQQWWVYVCLWERTRDDDEVVVGGLIWRSLSKSQDQLSIGHSILRLFKNLRNFTYLHETSSNTSTIQHVPPLKQ